MLKFALVCPCCKKEVFSSYASHDLLGIAMLSGLYYPLWDNKKGFIAGYSNFVGAEIKKGIRELKGNPDFFKIYSDCSDLLLAFAKDCFRACCKNPNAYVSITHKGEKEAFEDGK